jgi:hypothetical protein
MQTYTEKHVIESVGNCTLFKEGEEFIMDDGRGNRHSISADPSITPPERLEAHWQPFLKRRLEGLYLKYLDDDDLVTEFEEIIQDEIDQGADICEEDWQVVAVDEYGERVTGDPVGDGEGPPSLALVQKYFDEYPEAVELYFQGTSYVGDDEFDREIFGWWALLIYR